MKIIKKNKIFFTCILLLSIVLSNAQENVTKYKYGFIDTKTGKEITPIKYDYLDIFRNGIALVELDNKYGVINREGKEITGIKYDEVLVFNTGLIKVKLNNKYGVINREGKEIIEIKYDGVLLYSNSIGLIKVELNKKYGIINREGKEIAPIKYDVIDFKNDVTIVKLGGKFGAINSEGKEVIPIIYDDIKSIDRANSLYDVKLKGKSGLFNEKFEQITPLIYNEIIWSSVAIGIKVNDKYGFINHKGEEITEIKYDSISYPKNIGKKSLIPAKLANKWSFINNLGNEVFPDQYDAYNRKEFNSYFKMLPVSNNGKWGCVNENLIEVMPPIYDKIDFQKGANLGFIIVDLNNKFGVFDIEGNELVAVGYDEVKIVFPDFLLLKINDKWCIKSGTGKEILSPKYEKINFLYNSVDLFAVKINDKWGVRKKGDEIVIPAKYNEGISFYDSKITATLENKIIIFDEKGKVIPQKRKKNYNYLRPYYCGTITSEKREQFDSYFIKVEKNGKWILADDKGNEVNFPIKNDIYYNYIEGAAIVKMKINQNMFRKDLFKKELYNQTKKKKRNVMIKIQYDHVWNFKNGIARVQLNGKWGAINKAGEIIIPTEFDWIEGRTDRDEVNLKPFKVKRFWNF